jgi:two-component system chemotaxis response regulator CheB
MSRAVEAIVMGASAGAVEALSAILPALPEGFALPVLVVVHVPPGRTNALVPLFGAKCRLPVREAEDKAPIEGGAIYFAPADYHMLVETDRTLGLSDDPPVLHSRPSIDVLFESAADAYGPALAGVVLTGANADGAAGLKALAEAGGLAFVEDPAGAHVPAMPQAALDACPSATPARLTELASLLIALGSR